MLLRVVIGVVIRVIFQMKDSFYFMGAIIFMLLNGIGFTQKLIRVSIDVLRFIFKLHH